VLLFVHGIYRFMTTSSVSFRITRHTEDLAHTIHALSQRVVQLEQRLATLEAHLTASQEESPSSEHLASLANVDQLLRDCRELLAESVQDDVVALADAPEGPAAIQSLKPDPSGLVNPLDDLEEAA